MKLDPVSQAPGSYLLKFLGLSVSVWCGHTCVRRENDSVVYGLMCYVLCGCVPVHACWCVGGCVQKTACGVPSLVVVSMFSLNH